MKTKQKHVLFGLASTHGGRESTGGVEMFADCERGIPIFFDFLKTASALPSGSACTLDLRDEVQWKRIHEGASAALTNSFLVSSFRLHKIEDAVLPDQRR